jgi:outer membrane protein OmpA-like peptidoglycan-associated protein
MEKETKYILQVASLLKKSVRHCEERSNLKAKSSEFQLLRLLHCVRNDAVKFSLVLIFMLFTNYIYAQKAKDYIKTANKAFEYGDFKTSSELFKKAISLDTKNQESMYKYAESCRLSYQYNEAEKYYRKIYELNNEQFPLALFWYANVMKNKAFYEKAKTLFQYYVKQHSSAGDYYTKKAKYELISCDEAMKLMKKIKGIEIKTLNKTINTKFSEFGAFDIKDKLLVFSSNNFQNDTSDKNKVNSKIYFSVKKDTTWVEPKLFDTIINIANANVSNICFTEDMKTAYFSISNENEKSKLFTSKIENGKWSNPQALPSSINYDGFNTTQVNLVKIQNSFKLLFASDRPNGFGKFDLWYCNINKDGTYSEPVNLGDKINSFDDEITPFYSAYDTTLYFSSNHYANLGSFDIFKSKGDFKVWKLPENMGFPINSPYNDLYYIFNSDTSKAYFVSNRAKSSNNCCNDIYYHKIQKIEKTIPKVVMDSIKYVEQKKIIVNELESMMPITLYFDNDQPNPKTTDTITNVNFETTVKSYLALINEYKKYYLFGLSEEDLDFENDFLENFFNNQVEYNYEKLKKFTNHVQTLLEKGEIIKITLKGYTSPLNTAEYNKNLAKRRVFCIQNFFLEFNNGVLKKYTEGLKPTLIFKLEPIGKQFANPRVSDNINDKRMSVYSPDAATERRVQIIAVSVKE